MPGGRTGADADERLNVRLGDLLLRVLRLARRRIGRAITAAYGLSLTEVLVLSVIGKEPALRLGDLSRAVGIPASTLTGLVGRLEAQGYVRRRPDTSDRRVVLVAGTRQLEALLPEVVGLVRRDMEPVLAALSPDEADDLLRGLQRLASLLEAREGLDRSEGVAGTPHEREHR